MFFEVFFAPLVYAMKYYEKREKIERKKKLMTTNFENE